MNTQEEKPIAHCLDCGCAIYHEEELHNYGGLCVGCDRKRTREAERKSELDAARAELGHFRRDIPPERW